jgi:hypothetical protein
VTFGGLEGTGNAVAACQLPAAICPQGACTCSPATMDSERPGVSSERQFCKQIECG